MENLSPKEEKKLVLLLAKKHGLVLTKSMVKSRPLVKLPKDRIERIQQITAKGERATIVLGHTGKYMVFDEEGLKVRQEHGKKQGALYLRGKLRKPQASAQQSESSLEAHA